MLKRVVLIVERPEEVPLQLLEAIATLPSLDSCVLSTSTYIETQIALVMFPYETQVSPDYASCIAE